jgi:hypothetical protein
MQICLQLPLLISASLLSRVKYFIRIGLDFIFLSSSFLASLFSFFFSKFLLESALFLGRSYRRRLGFLIVFLG